MASEHPSKKARMQPMYELLYHPGIPGRGEFMRLAFEATGTPYTDIANEDKDDGYKTVQEICIDPSGLESFDDNPPLFSPPALRVRGEGKNGRDLVISQTPNCLFYLGEKLALVGEGEAEKLWVQQVVLTALDMNNETHDTHHPVAVGDYYEAQKLEALKKANDFREKRLPKYFSYFQRALKWNDKEGSGREGHGLHFVSNKLTIADLAVWQVLDGLFFAFPNEMKARETEFSVLLGDFYKSLKQGNPLKEYLQSKRRLPYSQGIFRHYAELDRQAE